MVVDIRRSEGRDALLSPGRDADIFIENMTPGRLDQRGLGFRDLHALKADLVNISISGWRQSGQLAHLLGCSTVVGARTDAQFGRLCQLPRLDHMSDEPAYATRLKCQATQVELNELFGSWREALSRPQLLDLLNAAHIPCAPVTATTAELLVDSELVTNGFVVALDHPTKGRLWQVSTPFEIDGQQGTIGPAPLMGQHTDDVLREHASSEEQIQALRAVGAVR